MGVARVNVSARPGKFAALERTSRDHCKRDSTFTSRFRRSPPEFCTLAIPGLKVPPRYDRLSWRDVIDSATGYLQDGTHSNAQLKPRPLTRYCGLGRPAQEFQKQAVLKLGLSARAHGRMVRVARTIADLAGSDKIEPLHVGEAIQSCSLGRRMEV